MSNQEDKEINNVFTKWYADGIRDFSNVQISFLQENIRRNHYKILENIYIAESSHVDWHCYTCHKPIKVNINSFDIKSVYCEEHKPKRITKALKNDMILMRVLNSVYTKIKTVIDKNLDM